MSEIPLRNRKGEIVAVALVDNEDAASVAQHAWRLSSNGYACRGVKGPDGRWGATLLLHRFLLALGPGDDREGDHVNGDKLDNRRANLRLCTRAQNLQNRHYGYGSSRFRGVTRDDRKNRWVAQHKLKGKRHYIGSFHSELEAARAAQAFRDEHMPYALPDPALAEAA